MSGYNSLIDERETIRSNKATFKKFYYVATPKTARAIVSLLKVDVYKIAVVNTTGDCVKAHLQRITQIQDREAYDNES